MFSQVFEAMFFVRLDARRLFDCSRLVEETINWHVSSDVLGPRSPINHSTSYHLSRVWLQG